jgi:hypothetical protein
MKRRECLLLCTEPDAPATKIQARLKTGKPACVRMDILFSATCRYWPD